MEGALQRQARLQLPYDRALVTCTLEALMLFLGLGLVLLALKLLEVGPVAAWSWMWILAPFALAALWWTWADKSGYTRRKAMEREDARKQARIDKQREAIGIPDPKKKRH